MRGLEVGTVLGGMAAAAVASARIAGEQAAREADQIYAFQTVEAWAAECARLRARAVRAEQAATALAGQVAELEDALADAEDELEALGGR